PTNHPNHTRRSRPPELKQPAAKSTTIRPASRPPTVQAATPTCVEPTQKQQTSNGEHAIALMRLRRTCTIHLLETGPHGNEPKKQQPLQRDQVHHQKNAADPGFAGIGSASAALRPAARRLALTKFAFNGYAVACICAALLFQYPALFR